MSSKTTIEYRPATINEAVESIMRCHSMKDRKDQLSFFKDHNGEAFANKVKYLVESKFKKIKK